MHRHSLTCAICALIRNSVQRGFPCVHRSSRWCFMTASLKKQKCTDLDHLQLHVVIPRNFPCLTVSILIRFVVEQDCLGFCCSFSVFTCNCAVSFICITHFCTVPSCNVVVTSMCVADCLTNEMCICLSVVFVSFGRCFIFILICAIQPFISIELYDNSILMHKCTCFWIAHVVEDTYIYILLRFLFVLTCASFVHPCELGPMPR